MSGVAAPKWAALQEKGGGGGEETPNMNSEEEGREGDLTALFTVLLYFYADQGIDFGWIAYGVMTKKVFNYTKWVFERIYFLSLIKFKI